MSERDDAEVGRQKGSQEHAEGQHGDKTHSRFLEELHSGTSDDSADAGTARKSERPSRDAED